MENLQQFITIIGGIIGVIATATGFFIPLIKNVKAKKALEAVNKFTSVIQPYVVEAEKFVNYSGAEKKQYVLTAVNDYAIKNGLTFDSNFISTLIEEIVSTTKQVNSRAKDASATPAQAAPSAPAPADPPQMA